MFTVVTRVGIGGAIEEEALAKANATLKRARLTTEEDIIAHAAEADAVLVGATEPYTARVIGSLRHCKIISRLGIGCDNIDIPAATAKGIPIACVPDASMEEVADHTLALLLAFARRLIPLREAVSLGEWRMESKALQEIRAPMRRLSQQTLGLVGVGRIGAALAHRAAALRMRVIAYDPYVGGQQAQKLEISFVNLDRLLKESDYISIHCPLTSETRHLLDREALGKLKSSCVLLNTARGGVVDEQALYEALRSGRLAGAGLDVTDPEPPTPGNPLLSLHNVIMTGHSAFYSDASMLDLRRRAIEAVVAVFRGQWPTNLANPEVRERKNQRSS